MNIENGKEQEWCSLSDDQAEVKHELGLWAARTLVDITTAYWVCLGLWGDAAPSSNNGSVCLSLFQTLSGIHNSRFWFCCSAKRHLCRRGCFGRHTLDGIFQVWAWACRTMLKRPEVIVQESSLQNILEIVKEETQKMINSMAGVILGSRRSHAGDFQQAWIPLPAR